MFFYNSFTSKDKKTGKRKSGSGEAFFTHNGVITAEALIELQKEGRIGW